jgi:hypothetical protein
MTGLQKWICLLGSIIILEMLPGPTLSASHATAVQYPRNRLPLLVLHAYIVAHLWRLIPERLDPLRNLDKIRVARN